MTHAIIRTGFCLLSFFISGLSTLAHASNGNSLIGISPISTSLGGTGVAATQNGTDAIYKNPATLSELKDKSGQLGVEMSSNLVKINSSAQTSAAAGEKNSSNPAKVLPAIAATYQLNDQMGVGLAMLAHGGAATDYNGEVSLSEFKTDLALIRILPTFSYQPTEMFSFGISPVIAYGAFALNKGNAGVVGTQSSRQPHGSTGLGVQIGATVHPVKALTLGATFLTKTGFNFENILNLDAFGSGSTAANAGLDGVKVETPMELAFGTAYAVTDAFNLYADYRFINWSKADSYKELGWRDQHVLAFGAEYVISKFALRGGFNWGRSVIPDVNGENGLTPEVDFQGHVVFPSSTSTLNAVAFPAYSESHLTLGVGYQVSENLSLDSSFLYAFKKSISRSGTTTAAYTFVGRVSQWQAGLGVRYLFN